MTAFNSQAVACYSVLFLGTGYACFCFCFGLQTCDAEKPVCLFGSWARYLSSLFFFVAGLMFVEGEQGFRV